MSLIDDYLRNVDDDRRAALERVRRIVSKTVPEAEEVISYGMPGFKYKKKYLFGFAPFKDHMSIFPAAEPLATMADQLKDFKTSKGTIQFTLEKPIPEEIITGLLAIRMKAIDG